jgi:phosphoserine phosphatase
VLRSAYAQFVYLVGGADHDQMEKMRQFMSQLCAGWDVATVREIVAETLHHIVDPLVYDEAVSLIEEHRLAGRDVVIVSTLRHRGGRGRSERCSAPTGWWRPGWRSWTAGTPATSSTTRTPEEKARAIRELADERRLRPRRSYAYSDSVTDVHMLEAVGHPHAVNPDTELRRSPAARVAVLVFTKPVALRRRCRSRRQARRSRRSPSAASSRSAGSSGPTPRRRRLGA